MGEKGNAGGHEGDRPFTSQWRRAMDAAREAGRGMLVPWFGLTASEQDAVLAVLALFALGLAVRWWLARA